MARLICVVAACAALCACSESGAPDTPMAGAPADVDPVAGDPAEAGSGGGGSGGSLGQQGVPPAKSGEPGITDGGAEPPEPSPQPPPTPEPGGAPPPACSDADNDSVCDEDDACPGHRDGLDSDGDGVPDGCDDYPNGGSADDFDGDGVPNAFDPCDGKCTDTVYLSLSSSTTRRQGGEKPYRLEAGFSDKSGRIYEMSDISAIGVHQIMGTALPNYDPADPVQYVGVFVNVVTQDVLWGMTTSDKIDLSIVTVPNRWLFYLEAFDVIDCDVSTECIPESGLNGQGRWQVTVSARWEMRGE